VTEMHNVPVGGAAVVSRVLTQMYGPAVRCNVWSGRAEQEISTSWGERSCINVSGL
jgi:hypothetical protein